MLHEKMRMKVKEQLHELYVISKASSDSYYSLVNDATPQLCLAINEVFHNISQLSFPLKHKRIQQLLEDNADIVEDLETQNGAKLKKILLDNKSIVQGGISLALAYIHD